MTFKDDEVLGVSGFDIEELKRLIEAEAASRDDHTLDIGAPEVTQPIA